MTVTEGTDRVANSHGQSTAGFIIKMIRDAEVDEYLKAIFDAVKERKSDLENIGDLPGQKQVPESSIDVAKIKPDVNPTPPPAPNLTANAGARYYGQKGKGPKRVYPKPARPAPDMVPMAGRVSPLKSMDGIEPSQIFGYGGLMYSKKDLVGACLTGQFEGYDIRFQVIGIGPKAVKVLLIDEPPAHIQHNKKSLHGAWANNEPIFIGHAALAPWLDKS